MNKYYSEIIEGLVLSEQHHCQLETALLTEMQQKNAEPEVKPNTEPDENVSYR